MAAACCRSYCGMACLSMQRSQTTENWMRCLPSHRVYQCRGSPPAAPRICTTARQMVPSAMVPSAMAPHSPIRQTLCGYRWGTFVDSRAWFALHCYNALTEYSAIHAGQGLKSCHSSNVSIQSYPYMSMQCFRTWPTIEVIHLHCWNLITAAIFFALLKARTDAR